MNFFYRIKLHLHLFRYKFFKKSFYYSKNNEDLFLSNYFKNKLNGRYIDIGAHHPYRSSNTCLLWNPDLFVPTILKQDKKFSVENIITGIQKKWITLLIGCVW